MVKVKLKMNKMDDKFTNISFDGFSLKLPCLSNEFSDALCRKWHILSLFWLSSVLARGCIFYERAESVVYQETRYGMQILNCLFLSFACCLLGSTNIKNLLMTFKVLTWKWNETPFKLLPSFFDAVWTNSVSVI